jgi:signal transduction histidine kinase
MRTPQRPRRLPWWADVVLGVAVTILYAVELVAWDADDLPLMVLAAAVGGVGLSLRRTSPLVAFVLAMTSIELITRTNRGFDNDSAALVVTFFVALWSLGRHTTGSERWIGALGVLVVVVNFVLDESPDGLDAGDLAFSAAFAGAPWLAGVTMRVRQDRDRTWRARTAALQAEQEERERRAVTAERSRIARELHDVVSHAIAVTVLQARGARRQLGNDEDAVRRALDAIDHTNTQALSDMRRLLALLRDTEDNPLGAPQPTLDRLPSLVDDLRGSGLPVDLDVIGDPRHVPPGVELSAYRIVQEALTNVLKHAGPGATATVNLRYGEEALELDVVDDGRGPVDDHRLGHGLVGIRERVAVVGGEVSACPGDGGGFAVAVRLPYAMEA